MKTLIFYQEAENETIDRQLEMQFNEGLQSKIAHTHHEGFGFHGDRTSPSSSSDWQQHESTKTTFVPARKAEEASADHTEVDNNEKVED